MWTERPVLAWNGEFGSSHIDAFGQFRQLRSGLDADPEYARSLRGGKESVSAHANFKGAAFNLLQTFGDGRDLLRRLFSDELQRDMQRFRTHPARFGRKSLDAFEEA